MGKNMRQLSELLAQFEKGIIGIRELTADLNASIAEGCSYPALLEQELKGNGLHSSVKDLVFAYCQMNGIGVVQHIGVAYTSYTLIAANAPSPLRNLAHCLLGHFYYHYGLESDAIKHYSAAAVSYNSIEVYTSLAAIYRKNRNLAEAFKYGRKVADLGNVEYQRLIGEQLLLGKNLPEGVPADEKAGIGYSELSAGRGNVDAMNNLGLFYLNRESLFEALLWFKTAEGHARNQGMQSQLEFAEGNVTRIMGDIQEPRAFWQVVPYVSLQKYAKAIIEARPNKERLVIDFEKNFGERPGKKCHRLYFHIIELLSRGQYPEISYLQVRAKQGLDEVEISALLPLTSRLQELDISDSNPQVIEYFLSDFNQAVKTNLKLMSLKLIFPLGFLSNPVESPLLNNRQYCEMAEVLAKRRLESLCHKIDNDLIMNYQLQHQLFYSSLPENKPSYATLLREEKLDSTAKKMVFAMYQELGCDDIPQNIKQAVATYQELAVSYPPARAYLGRLYQYGLVDEIQPSFNEASLCYESSAAEQKSHLAFLRRHALVLFHSNSEEAKKASRDAVEKFANEEKSGVAYYQLALYYFGVRKYNEAIAMYDQYLRFVYDPSAKGQLGIIAYFYSQGENSKKWGLRIMKEAAEGGDKVACLELSLLFLAGRETFNIGLRLFHRGLSLGSILNIHLIWIHEGWATTLDENIKNAASASINRVANRPHIANRIFANFLMGELNQSQNSHVALEWYTKALANFADTVFAFFKRENDPYSMYACVHAALKSNSVNVIARSLTLHLSPKERVSLLNMRILHQENAWRIAACYGQVKFLEMYLPDCVPLEAAFIKNLCEDALQHDQVEVVQFLCEKYKKMLFSEGQKSALELLLIAVQKRNPSSFAVVLLSFVATRPTDKELHGLVNAISANIQTSLPEPDKKYLLLEIILFYTKYVPKVAEDILQESNNPYASAREAWRDFTNNKPERLLAILAIIKQCTPVNDAKDEKKEEKTPNEMKELASLRRVCTSLDSKRKKPSLGTRQKEVKLSLQTCPSFVLNAILPFLIHPEMARSYPRDLLLFVKMMSPPESVVSAHRSTRLLTFFNKLNREAQEDTTNATPNFAPF
jgi:TPR repeat protein